MSVINLSKIRGERGQIYIARKGHAIILCLDNGVNYMIHQSGHHIIPVADEYWTHSIEWRGGFSEHWTWGVKPSMLDQKYPAKYICEPTRTQMERLEKSMASNPATASEIGRMGGSVKSESKSRASAENGKKGGRPKKRENQNRPD